MTVRLVTKALRQSSQSTPSFNTGKCFTPLLQSYRRPYYCNDRQLDPRCLRQPPGQRRDFSTSEAINLFLQGSETLISNSHALTGTPWFLTLPMVALVTNLVVRGPILWSSHQTAHKRARLVHLVQAQTAMVARGLRKKNVTSFIQTVAKVVKKRRNQLFRSFSIDNTRPILGTFLALPVFISNMEVLRRLCGRPDGALGSLVFMMNKSGNQDAAVATTAGETASEALSSAHVQDIGANIVLDPSLAMEGCLWFPSLLAPDPYHILPFAVSAAMVASILPHSAAGIREFFLGSSSDSKSGVMQHSRWRYTFHRFLFTVALAMGPMTMDLPAALHLYWFASSTSSLAMSKTLRALQPLPKQTITPCKGRDAPWLMPRPPKQT